MWKQPNLFRSQHQYTLLLDFDIKLFLITSLLTALLVEQDLQNSRVDSSRLDCIFLFTLELDTSNQSLEYIFSKSDWDLVSNPKVNQCSFGRMSHLSCSISPALLVELSAKDVIGKTMMTSSSSSVYWCRERNKFLFLPYKLLHYTTPTLHSRLS